MKYDTGQAAHILHVTPQTVIRHIKDGSIEARKVGKRWLIDEGSIARYIAGVTKQGVEATHKSVEPMHAMAELGISTMDREVVA